MVVLKLATKEDEKVKGLCKACLKDGGATNGEYRLTYMNENTGEVFLEAVICEEHLRGYAQALAEVAGGEVTWNASR